MAGIYAEVLMYADDLLLISSTCSDLQLQLQQLFVLRPLQVDRGRIT